MKGIYSYILLVFFVFTLFGCGPEWSFKQAEQARTEEAFQQFLRDYPESEFVERASNRLAEIEYWQRIKERSDKNAYEVYRDSFPDGLFLKEAEERIAYSKVKEEDLIEDYEAFLKHYPRSSFHDNILIRIDALTPAAEAYEVAITETDTDVLKEFIDKHKDTGYGKLVQVRLDSVALARAELEVLAKAEYSDLPSTFTSLEAYLKDNSDAANTALAEQALEDLLIEKIRISGSASFSIETIQPDTGKSLADLIDFSKSIDGFGGNFASRSGTAVNFKGLFARKDRVIDGSVYWGIGQAVFTLEDIDKLAKNVYGSISISQIGESTYKASTKLPRDKLYYEASMFISDFILPMGENSIYRFEGSVKNYFPNISILSDDENPLCFVLIEGSGLTYVKGSGSVILADGQEVELPVKG